MATALLVEDSVLEIEILSSYLKALNINIEIVESGEDAISKIDSKKHDLIILDVVLPGKSGFEVCRKLKGEDHTKNIPIIMCSTKNTEMDKFWGLKQGADAYLTKPVDQKEFNKNVKQLIN